MVNRLIYAITRYFSIPHVSTNNDYTITFSTLAANDREQDHDGGDDVDNVSDNADEDFKEPNKVSTVPL